MGAAPATISKAVGVASPASPTTHRLAFNFLFLSGGELTAKLLTFATFGYLARILGPEHYGFLEFTLAVMIFFTLPADLGLGAYGTREIARHPDRALQLLREITGLRLLLAICSVVGLGVFIAVINKPPELKLLLGFYGLSLLGGPFLLQWFFQAHDEMHWVGVASIVRQAAFTLVVFAYCRKGGRLEYLGIIECGSVFAVSTFCLFVVKHKMGVQRPWPSLRNLTAHLSESVPIGLAELAWAFMWYFCTVLLGFFYSDWTLGWFGASHRAVMALHTFVWLYFFNLLPSISRCVPQPKLKLLKLMDDSIRMTAWVGLFLASFLTVLAPLVLRIIYGPFFSTASKSFAVLVWMLPVAMLSGHHRYVLVAYRRQKQLLICTVISAAVAVVLGFVLVPPFRGRGAAWALVIANVVNFVLVYIAARKLVVHIPVHRQLAAPLLSLGAAALVYIGLLNWNPWLALAAATATYSLGLIWSDGPTAASFFRSVLTRQPIAAPVPE